MNILQTLLDDGQNLLVGTKEKLRIDNIILGKTLYTMKGCDLVFTDMNFCLVLLENAYGFSYFQQEINYRISKYVNQEINDALKENPPMYLKVAFADALYCLVNKKYIDKSMSFLKGDLRRKAQARAEKLLNRIPSGSKTLLFGAATEIIDEASRRNIDLTVLDLEQQKIGLEFDHTRIESGATPDLVQKIKNSDYIIATGMIFVSQTADEIFRIANENRIKLIMYMETGSNFGPQLLKFGADMVLSEFFPYYDFFGETKYSIFQK